MYNYDQNQKNPWDRTPEDQERQEKREAAAHALSAAAFACAVISVIAVYFGVPAIFFGGLAVTFSLLIRVTNIERSRRANLSLGVGFVTLIIGIVMMIYSLVYVVQNYGSFQNFYDYYYEQIEETLGDDA